ncbi:MAG TPA: DUF177 domain-containing protein [Syntrophomonadaceae bacterium]|nr:DUF177 domain-containing protein [Syntrophomonadaceae bacterium]
MIIDLRNLELHPGSREEFTLESRGDEALLKDLPGRFLASVQLVIMVQNAGHCFKGQGRLETRVELNCARCLENLIYPISTEFQFTVASEAEDHALQEGDILPYGDGQVDLEPLVNELIVTELPLTPLCQAECRGLCPLCGSNKNTHRCNCKDHSIDPRWEKLNKLR